MISTLVYCETKPNPNRQRGLIQAKGCLANEIPSVIQVNVSSEACPEDAFANEAGTSLLKSIKLMEEKINGLEKEAAQQAERQANETKALKEQQAKENQALKEQQAKENQALREEVAQQAERQAKENQALKEGAELQARLSEALEQEIMILQPLKRPAIGIRNRFYGTFLRSQERNIISLPTIITEGNRIAHDGDVVTDTFLLKHDLLHYARTFKTLYGVSWEFALGLCKFDHMVKAMNIRASALGGGHAWTKEKEFRKLLDWTLEASIDDLADFAQDAVGKNHGKLLFREVQRNSRKKGKSWFRSSP